MHDLLKMASLFVQERRVVGWYDLSHSISGDDIRFEGKADDFPNLMERWETIAAIFEDKSDGVVVEQLKTCLVVEAD